MSMYRFVYFDSWIEINLELFLRANKAILNYHPLLTKFIPNTPLAFFCQGMA